MSCTVLTAAGARLVRLPACHRIFYVVRCGDPQKPPCVKGVTCYIINGIITKVGCLNLPELLPQPIDEGN